MAKDYSSHGSSSEFRDDVNRVGEGIETMKSGAKDAAQSAADAARSGSAELRRGAGRAVDTAKDKLEDAKETAVDSMEQLGEIIARKPIASVGIAAGIGMIIGMMLCRPRS